MERAKIAYGTDDLQAHIAKQYTKKSRGSRDFYRMLASGIDRPLQAVCVKLPCSPSHGRYLVHKRDIEQPLLI